MSTPRVSGMTCGGKPCPYTTLPVVSCCTTQNDVDRRAAREVDRCGEIYSGSTRFGSACWERDQPGLVDPGCDSGNTDELGCCSEKGWCGSITDKIGCHYALDESPFRCESVTVNQPTDPGDPNDPTAPNNACDPLGTFGIVATVDVAWGGRSGGLVGITDDGRGPIKVYLKVNVESVSATREMTGSIEPCGVTLPPFYSTTLCESYNPIFPNEMWESPKMPSFPLLGHYSCYEPGCAITLDTQTTTIGIELADIEAPWPTPMQTGRLECPSGTGVACFPDQDADSLPGVTVDLNTDGTPAAGVGCSGNYSYEAAPLNADPTVIFRTVRRAESVLIGVRNKLGGSGRIADDCNSGIGNGVAEFFESRAWGCVVKEGSANLGGQPAGPNEACDSNEAQFMDENLPIYQVLGPGQPPPMNLNVTDRTASRGPLFSMVRLGAPGQPVNCAQVRDAPYPE